MALVEGAHVRNVYTKSYESFKKERKLLRQWEAFLQEVVSGTRKLSDKPPSVLSNGLHVPGANRLSSDATDYPAKAHIVENRHRDEAQAYWREMRKDVGKLNKLSLVNQWFGIPVRESSWGLDPANWARYSSKIKQPMDLRTISERLEGAGTPPQYTSPEQVAADIRLVVSNCETFNEGDSSDQVCKVARQLQNSWERRWQPDDGTGLWRRWQQMQARHTAEKRALKWVQSAPSDQIQSRLTRFGQMARRFLEEGPQILDATIPWEARRKLAIRLSQLNQDHVTHMLKVLEHLQPEALPAPTSGTDLTIDIDRLTLETMERLQVFLDHLAVHKGNKRKRAASKSRERERGTSQTAASSPAHTPNTTGMVFDTDAIDGIDWDMDIQAL